jgi:uncharacterized protein
MDPQDPPGAVPGDPEDEAPIEIPPALLSADTLRGVAESFVLREGTDYGERELSFERKVAQVLEQLGAGRAQLLFDPATESVTLRLRP